jgi:hypothetical protein
MGIHVKHVVSSIGLIDGHARVGRALDARDAAAVGGDDGTAPGRRNLERARAGRELRGAVRVHGQREIAARKQYTHVQTVS